MPNAYHFALFLHLLGVFGIAGTATTELVCLSMMRRARTAQELRPWADVAKMIEKAFPVAALVLLLSGAYMVSKDSALGWDLGWINVSATALIVGAIADFLINGRRVDAIQAAAQAAPDGPVAPALAAQLHDPVVFGTAHALMLMLLAIVWNMTTHPGDAQAGIVVVVAVLLGAGSAMPMVARRRAILEGGAER
ncbi:MAG: hypothetical protein KGK07_08070 [Chloroflexota bacterium]|nr:hypothetical protein [Chloroflexota bacterium]